MLDPVTAIGLASAIVAFVDFGYKVVKGAAEMYNGVDGALGENMTREAVVKQMMSLSARLQSPDSSHMVGQDRALCVLSSECHKISSDLLRLLESLRPAKPNSKSHSLRASLKAKIKDSERRDLEKRLDSCRAQLALHLNFANIASVDKLSEYVRGNPEALSALQNQVSELSTLVCAMGLATQQLIATQRRSVDKILYDSILESLAFGGLRHREDNIMEAHDKTLQWIFDNTAREKHDSLLKKHAASPGDEYNGFYRHERGEITVEDSALRLQEQKKLLNWLSSGSGIFHVSGKMGAGKSTFMKFLGMHSETRKRLKEWAAGEYELVVASFYFWRVGSPLQKSLAGLCRSLLHDVLKAHPDLIPDVFPDTWKTAVQASLTEQVRPEIREAEVREAFSRLVSNISLRTKHRFCFFIDGLDEYETTGSFDAADMANQLNAWTLASGNIKFCVSSREHNEFMGAFPSAQRLRLHEVTRLDIQLFVQERLSDYKSLDGYWDVVHSIVDKAAGVFIWVSTVVQRISPMSFSSSTST
ncbi:hypothetical protein F503_04903 [Ophiostoma piceae UAMH 11346]|uniref:Nephrocystin 3-like N-terminal domain-containing protein n=1 Tax=Ophiostoma piceae (strain UAMH 11346) TaxID=1262450 RepID=S3CTN0_OPHP1|nr:hypothetical protein F503_04903 [Ophiostoma piceae UAMH 11346]